MSASNSDGLSIAAFVGGASRGDVLISSKALSFKDLPVHSRIGTSSARRASQIKMIRNDVQILPIRGNVDTRIKKLKNGEYDAIILAKAGLERLGLTNEISYTFSVDEIVPAAGQGIMAAQIRENDQYLSDILKSINDDSSECPAHIEFELMKIIGADCDVPLGVFAQVKENIVDATIFLSSLDMKDHVKFTKKYNISRVEKIPALLADELRNSWKAKTGKELQLHEK